MMMSNGDVTVKYKGEFVNSSFSILNAVPFVFVATILDVPIPNDSI